MPIAKAIGFITGSLYSQTKVLKKYSLEQEL